MGTDAGYYVCWNFDSLIGELKRAAIDAYMRTQNYQITPSGYQTVTAPGTSSKYDAGTTYTVARPDASGQGVATRRTR